MAKRICLLIATASVVLTAVFLNRHSRAVEPIYEGKRLGEWLDMLGPNSTNAPSIEIATMNRAHATNALRAIGTNALPYLFDLLHRQDSKMKEVAGNLFGQAAIGRAAMQKFRLEFIYDRRERAAETFFALGPVTVPALIDLLKNDEDPAIRRIAGGVLARMGPDAKDAIPGLIASMNDLHPAVRQIAVEALGEMPDDSSNVIATLTTALTKDSVHYVRQTAAEALGKHGAHAKAAIPALLKAMRDFASGRAAAEALGKMGSNAKDAIPALREMSTNSNEGLRDAAKSALRMIDSDADAKAIPR